MSIKRDDRAVLDIGLTLIHAREFYNRTRQLRLNYARKVKKGTFDRDLAVRGYLNFVRNELEEPWFKRDYCDPRDLDLSPMTLQGIASYILDHYMEEIQDMAEDI